MRKKSLLLVIVLVVISLTGLIATQVFWLRKSIMLAEKQFDDRADRMLHDVVSELEQYSDTAAVVVNNLADSLILFDVVDTVLLDDLVKKYAQYHMLDSLYHYGLIRTSDDHIFFATEQFLPHMEPDAYKACLSCIWQKEYIHLSVFFPNKRKQIYEHMVSWMILSLIFLVIISAVFISVIYSIVKQKKISEIRNDFINNMTHEFKTPISTISLASEILMKEGRKQESERLGKYSKIIYEENRRMQSQVELVLQTALLERQNTKLKKERVDMHELILGVGENCSIDRGKKKTEIRYELKALRHALFADPTHLKNVISNLIDNGIKYSREKAVITIITENRDEGFLLTIKDQGIGMTRETQKRIFDKFYRVSTGNQHDVKGFGLGLYYVKSIVEAHNGSVHVTSTLNKGSSFFVYLPDASDPNQKS